MTMDESVGPNCGWTSCLRRIAICVGIALFLSVAAAAQDSSQPFPLNNSTKPNSLPLAAGFALTPWQFSIGYQYSQFNIRGALAPFGTHGVNGSITRFFNRALGLEGMADAGFGSSSPGHAAASIFWGGGVHFAYRTQRRYEPWVHVLIGVEHFAFEQIPPPFNPTALAWVAGGGVDYRLKSGLALRIQGDYLGTNFGSAFQRNFQIVGGAVWNF